MSFQMKKKKKKSQRVGGPAGGGWWCSSLLRRLVLLPCNRRKFSQPLSAPVLSHHPTPSVWFPPGIQKSRFPSQPFPSSSYEGFPLPPHFFFPLQSMCYVRVNKNDVTHQPLANSFFYRVHQFQVSQTKISYGKN